MKMAIDYRDGLLFTSLRVTCHGKTGVIENVVIDTGATHSILSPDSVHNLGLEYQDEDQIVTSVGLGGRQYAFVKKVDKVDFGPFNVNECNMDFCVIDQTGRVNGLLGLDLLSRVGAVIDLKNMLLYEGI
ncbi:MAG: retropepsin-like aspartic protease [Bacillota bacterium]|nr:retropepsin-like domain-containing protein [Bacillota bacterium]